MNILPKFTSYAPRWLVFIVDVCFSLFAIVLAAFIIKHFNMAELNWKVVFKYGFIIGIVRITSFLLSKTYSGIVRHTGTQDVWRIFFAVTGGEVVLLLFNTLFFFIDGEKHVYIPFEFLFIEYFSLMFLMVFSRLVFKHIYAHFFDLEKADKKVIIYGSDEYGLMVKHVLDNAVDANWNVIAFIDPDSKKRGKQLEGVRIYNSSYLPVLLKRNKVDRVIIALKHLAYDKKRQLIETCLENNVNVLKVPNFERWINGELSVKQIRNIKIEDLLNRGVIELDDEAIRKQLLNKTILVTGAAGSIGSEIVRQLTNFNPKKIILVDIAETPLYDLELELNESYHFKNFVVELGNIRDYACLEKIYSLHRPDIVYHAAAYKHVPMVENLPFEGIKTNILGTKNVADLAVKYNCEKFVMVSTDKAVNPTNVMGCTKRIAEIYTQSLNKTTDTAFITTRFGNVLGSNGSVIPRFTRQIEAGGPITVTHPEITRFFMTIPEACQLVLQAGSLGEGGEIFAFDMGESVKILTLAKNMIRLSGLEVGKDINIVYTGMRPGEKLYEEVLNDDETLLPTPHKRIFKAKVREYDFELVKEDIEILRRSLSFENAFGAVRVMKSIVPEFKSKNSVYEEIDFQIEKDKSQTAEA